MKTMFKSFSMLAVAACAGIGFVSCNAEKDYFNAENAEQFVKAEYAANFVKKYGAINPDQSWDFTNGTVTRLPFQTSRSTRAVEFNPTVTHYQHADGSEGTYYVEKATTLDYLNENLKEGDRSNFNKGTSFVLRMPGSSFTIMPVYVGHASLTWTLHLVAENPDTREIVDLPIWSKGNDVAISTDGTNYTELDAAGNSMDVDYVRTQAHTISGMAPGTRMWLYLQTSQNKQMSSLNDQMIALTGMKTPTNLPACIKEGVAKDREVMIIGCEDLDVHTAGSGCDFDMNDVVFLIYGDPDLPQQERVEVVVDEDSKRYMIEDLGATDDFDFNDIVIDVTRQRTVKHHYIGNTPVEKHDEYGEWVCTATLRHLGGILPFTVKVGDTPMSWEPNIDENGVVRGDAAGEVVTVTGWDPELNNVTVSVDGRGDNSGYQNTFSFPKTGEVPMIIATEITEMWMNERVSIEKRW